MLPCTFVQYTLHNINILYIIDSLLGVINYITTKFIFKKRRRIFGSGDIQ